MSYYLAEEELFVFVMRADGGGEVHLANRDYWRYELEREGAFQRRRKRKFV